MAENLSTSEIEAGIKGLLFGSSPDKNIVSNNSSDRYQPNNSRQGSAKSKNPRKKSRNPSNKDFTPSDQLYRQDAAFSGTDLNHGILDTQSLAGYKQNKNQRSQDEEHRKEYLDHKSGKRNKPGKRDRDAVKQQQLQKQRESKKIPLPHANENNDTSVSKLMDSCIPNMQIAQNLEKQSEKKSENQRGKQQKGEQVIDENTIKKIKEFLQQYSSSEPTGNLKKLTNEPVTKEEMRKLEVEFIFPLKKKNPRFPKAWLFCRICEYHCDNIKHCQQHIKGDRHLRLKELRDADDLLKNLPAPTANHIVALDTLLEDIFQSQALTDVEMEHRKEVVNQLQQIVQNKQPDVRLVLYGSSVNGFGLKSSDVNIDVIVPVKSNPATVLTSALESLKECDFCSSVQSDFSAKIPHIDVICEGLFCELSVGSVLACETSELLSNYCKIDPRVRKLGVAFRYWAKICKIDVQSEGSLPAYAFSLMVVFFLQQLDHPVLPVLHQLLPQGMTSPPLRIVEGKNCWYNTDIDHLNWRTSNTLTVGELWVAIFKFYSLEFDMSLYIVCIRQHKYLTKEEKKWTNKKLAVEDPFSTKRNLTRSVSHGQIFEYIYGRLRVAYKYFGIPQTKDGPVFSNVEMKVQKRCVITDDNLQSKEKDSNQHEASLKGTLLPVNCAAKDVDSNSCSSDNEESTNSRDGFKESLKNVADAHNWLDDHIHKIADDPQFLDEKLSIEDALLDSIIMNAVESSPRYQQKLQLESEISIHKESLNQTNDNENGRDETEFKTTSLSASDESESNSNSVNPDDLGNKKHKGLVSDIIANITKDSAENSENLVSNGINDARDIAVLKEVVLSDDQGNVISKELVEKLGCKEFNFLLNEDLSDSKGPPVMCKICQMAGHLKQNCPEENLPKLIPLPKMNSKYKQLLNSVLLLVPRDFEPTPSEVRKRNEIVLDLERFLHDLYPDTKLSLFGSSCNGFGFRHSDLDICMTFEQETAEGLNCVEIIENVAKKLKSHRGFYQILPITTAKVPIVKFCHKRTVLEGDISLYNTLAQHNTRMLLTYTNIDPRVRILGYVMKVFAKTCDIGDASRGSLSSYAYILLVLYYLQQCNPPVIPVLQELHDKSQPKPEVNIDGWNAWFCADIKNLQTLWPEYGKNKLSVAELWVGMLRFYTEEFNYTADVVCLRQHKTLTRFEKLWNGKCIAIEDPFDLNHNLGAGLSRKMHNFILKAFINGRHLFGIPKTIQDIQARGYETSPSFFFDPGLLIENQQAPNDRGCRICGKIGHIAKECQIVIQRKERGQRERDRKNEQKQREQQQRNNAKQQIPQQRSRQPQQQQQHHQSPARNGQVEMSSNTSTAINTQYFTNSNIKSQPMNIPLRPTTPYTAQQRHHQVLGSPVQLQYQQTNTCPQQKRTGNSPSQSSSQGFIFPTNSQQQQHLTQQAQSVPRTIPDRRVVHPQRKRYNSGGLEVTIQNASERNKLPSYSQGQPPVESRHDQMISSPPGFYNFESPPRPQHQGSSPHHVQHSLTTQLSPFNLIPLDPQQQQMSGMHGHVQLTPPSSSHHMIPIQSQNMALSQPCHQMLPFSSQQQMTTVSGQQQMTFPPSQHQMASPPGYHQIASSPDHRQDHVISQGHQMGAQPPGQLYK